MMGRGKTSWPERTRTMSEANPKPYWFHWPPEVFEDMQERLEKFYESGRRAFSQLTRQPALDVKETPERFVIEVDVPGVDPEKCEVSILDRTVFIRGSREFPELGREERLLRAERRSGEFSREVTLPADVEQGDASAHYQAGVLRIAVMKKNAARPHKVQVRSD